MKSENSLPATLKRVQRLLPLRRKRQLAVLVALLLLAAVFEILTLASVPLFISTLLEPDVVLKNPFFAEVLETIDVKDPNALRITMALALTIFALASTTVRLSYTWTSMRLSQAIRCDFSELALGRSMRREWVDHVRSNSGVALSGILEKTTAMIVGLITPLMTLVGAIVVVLSVAATLVIVEPVAAAIAVGSSFIFYAIILKVLRNRVAAAGRRIAEFTSTRTIIVQAALGGMREVILDGAQGVYERQFARVERRRAIDLAFMGMAGNAPRLMMELVFVLLIASLSLLFFYQSNTPGQALSSLGFLAFSCLRMLPSAQQIYYSLSLIRQNQAIVSDTLNLIEQPQADMPEAAEAELPFENALALQDVWFRYHADLPWILRGVSLEIQRGERIGVVGSTGSGKSSLIDLIMGLLVPDKGEITVDGTPIRGSIRRAWMARIGHVPQSVFLTDESVADNIAFGLGTPDPERIRDAAKLAKIQDLIDSDTGERGMRLSGGQRQRVGIARALYRRKDVLVLDEATSALDSSTERDVMAAIDALSTDTTIVMIAHRLSTVRNCDRILLLEAGEVRGFAPWDELVQNNPAFRDLVSAASGTTVKEAF